MKMKNKSTAQFDWHRFFITPASRVDRRCGSAQDVRRFRFRACGKGVGFGRGFHGLQAMLKARVRFFVPVCALVLATALHAEKPGDVVRQVPALLPPTGMPREVQLAHFVRCKSESENPSLGPASKADLALVGGRDNRIFFTGSLPQMAQPWYPAALVNKYGGWDATTVSRAAADAFVVCFLKLGYSYGTYRQRLQTD